MTYFIYRNGRQEGPYDIQAIINMHLSGDTFVWREGMSDWQPIHTIPELRQPSTPPPSYQQTTMSGQRNYGYSSQYQQPYSNSQPQFPQPQSHLALAIISTLFCCLPTGIYALVQSSRVESLYAAGRYDAAVNASRSSMRWSIAGMILAVVGTLLYVLLIIVVGVSFADL